jgi:calcineurin-like phosphoesterase family protein
MGTSIKTWFTSDTHLSHPSILYFHPKRRMAAGITLEELQADKKTAIEKHDEWLIDLWNKTVKKQDNIYILGDFCLGNRERTEQILKRLNGKKYLIRGNHDKSCKGLENYFEWVGDIKEVKFTHNQYPFIDPDETFAVELCHFPMVAWNRRPHGTCHLHGHCHSSLDKYNDFSQELRLDIGIDSKIANLGLVDLETVYQHMVDIKTASGSKTFIEHTEKIMDKLGFRA